MLIVLYKDATRRLLSFYPQPTPWISFWPTSANLSKIIYSHPSTECLSRSSPIRSPMMRRNSSDYHKLRLSPHYPSLSLCPSLVRTHLFSICCLQVDQGEKQRSWKRWEIQKVCGKSWWSVICPDWSMYSIISFLSQITLAQSNRATQEWGGEVHSKWVNDRNCQATAICWAIPTLSASRGSKEIAEPSHFQI